MISTLRTGEPSRFWYSSHHHEYHRRHEVCNAIFSSIINTSARVGPYYRTPLLQFRTWCLWRCSWWKFKWSWGELKKKMNHRNPHPRHDQRCGPSTGDIAMLPHQPGRIANSGGQKTGSSPITLGWGFYQAASRCEPALHGASRIERPRWLILVHERVRNAGT